MSETSHRLFRPIGISVGTRYFYGCLERFHEFHGSSELRTIELRRCGGGIHLNLCLRAETESLAGVSFIAPAARRTRIAIRV